MEPILVENANHCRQPDDRQHLEADHIVTFFQCQPDNTSLTPCHIALTQTITDTRELHSYRMQLTNS